MIYELIRKLNFLKFKKLSILHSDKKDNLFFSVRVSNFFLLAANFTVDKRRLCEIWNYANYANYAKMRIVKYYFVK